MRPEDVRVVEDEPDRAERHAVVGQRQQRRRLRLRADLGEARVRAEDRLRALQPQRRDGARGVRERQLGVEREASAKRCAGRRLVARGVRELERALALVEQRHPGAARRRAPPRPAPPPSPRPPAASAPAPARRSWSAGGAGGRSSRARSSACPPWRPSASSSASSAPSKARGSVRLTPTAPSTSLAGQQRDGAQRAGARERRGQLRVARRSSPASTDDGAPLARRLARRRARPSSGSALDAREHRVGVAPASRSRAASRRSWLDREHDRRRCRRARGRRARRPPGRPPRASRPRRAPR